LDSPYTLDLLLHFDILLVTNHNFWFLPVFCDLDLHADLLVTIHFFGSSEFHSNVTPNQNGEVLARVGLVQVQKRRVAASRRGLARARHLAAHCRLLPDMVFAFGSGQPLNLRSLGKHITRCSRHTGQYSYLETSLDIHNHRP
jgi:hypothetical protein